MIPLITEKTKQRLLWCLKR